MNETLKEFFASGKKLLTDTKTPKPPNPPSKQKGKLTAPAAGSQIESDPHKIFIKRAIDEKMKAVDIVKQIQKFCDAEDALL